MSCIKDVIIGFIVIAHQQLDIITLQLYLSIKISMVVLLEKPSLENRSLYGNLGVLCCQLLHDSGPGQVTAA